MEQTRLNGVPVFSYNTVIVGSGAAGFNAAGLLWDLGQTDIAIVTEHINCGTSRNTGSDKQTYYKLTLSGGDQDSVREMAGTLFDGKCVDGDNALCEAALSAPGFLRLCGLGVQFPQNRYGEYIGYKTDHDPRRRATSVGPYTSKMMTEALEKDVLKKGVKIHDRCQAVKILTDEGRASGLLCLNENNDFVIFACPNIIYATGGPAGIYADSVYPQGHMGASGIAFEAGVKGQNLTEWQFGLASLRPRWNVSGTYMQALPRFVSTDPSGGDEREFLADYFKDPSELLSKVFLKGYQWPFDVRKAAGGSSVIDLLVYTERCKGRRVFLDFRENPMGREPDYAGLAPEAEEYLRKAGADFGRPIDRLLHMNAPAVDFYLEKGVDLKTRMLEISLCAQHNNGGLAVDCWWQTNIEGFFACGEVAGTHGVYRPGGSALNAGQAGSARAARFIAARRREARPGRILWNQVEESKKLVDIRPGVEENIEELLARCTGSMSGCGGAVRNGAGMEALLKEVTALKEHFRESVRVSGRAHLKKAYRLYDVLLSQQAYLSAMLDYIAHGGKSRGSALYMDDKGETECLGFRFGLSDGDRLIQETCAQGGGRRFYWRSPRPIPEDDDFFENVWRQYRENQNIDEG